MGAANASVGGWVSHRRRSAVADAMTTWRRSSSAAVSRPIVFCTIARVNHP